MRRGEEARCLVYRKDLGRRFIECRLVDRVGRILRAPLLLETEIEERPQRDQVVVPGFRRAIQPIEPGLDHLRRDHVYLRIRKLRFKAAELAPQIHEVPRFEILRLTVREELLSRLLENTRAAVWQRVAEKEPHRLGERQTPARFRGGGVQHLLALPRFCTNRRRENEGLMALDLFRFEGQRDELLCFAFLGEEPADLLRAGDLLAERHAPPRDTPVRALWNHDPVFVDFRDADTRLYCSHARQNGHFLDTCKPLRGEMAGS